MTCVCLQEPMQNAASERFQNPFSGLVDNITSTTPPNPQQGTENRDPLPNPWSPSGGQQSSGDGTNQSQPSAIPNLSNSNFSNILQQMSDNPSFLQNMMSAPSTQTMMEAMASDPEVANQIISQNPLLRGNPALQQQMRTMMPQVLEQLRNPEFQNLVSNPQASTFILTVLQTLLTLDYLGTH